MGEELSMDNILGAEEIDNLFQDITEPQDDPEPEEKDGETENKENSEVAEVNPDSLFDEDEEEKPESVGNDDDKKEKGDTKSEKAGSSPNTYIYSSIAKALKEEGIFPDLDDETANSIKAPEDFRDLIEEQIKAGLDERQKRIDEALGYGVKPDLIKGYEQTLSYLNNIQDSQITDESDAGEKIRKQLIYQDFINRGYSKERASREVQKSFNSGTDIDDAKEALSSTKDFYQQGYNNLIKEAKANAENVLRERQEKSEQIKKIILEDKNAFGDISVDKSTRQKIYDNIAKPVYKDPETGDYLTAIQRYERENTFEFLRNVGLVYTLTNGFKNFDGLVKGKVDKGIKKGLRELENVLNSTSRTSDGSLQFINNSGNSELESFMSKGWAIDA